MSRHETDKDSALNKKLAVLVLGICAMLAGLAVYFQTTPHNPAAELRDNLQTATFLPAGFKQWPDIEINDQHGRPVKKASSEGRWRLIFFGYTHCPDICPMTLTTISSALKNMENKYSSDFLETVFISVDPARDTPDHLKQYLSFFDAGFLGLSPDENALSAFTRDLGLIYKRVENPENPDAYLMDHTASMMLFDTQGEAKALFTMPHEPESIAADLITLHTTLGKQ